MYKRLLAATFMAICVFMSAGAVNSAEIATQIEQAEQGRQAAHDLAEAARKMGETDAHYTVKYAKMKWAEYTEELSRLKIAYNVAKEAEQKKYGRFKLTFYCPCVMCNGTSSGLAANGDRLTPGVTIAVDPSIIPLGSRVYIEGIGYRIAQDTGSAIRGRRIDVLVNGHSEAYRYGVRWADVKGA